MSIETRRVSGKYPSYEIVYEVQGNSTFPIDMLRYDESFPDSETDAHVIQRSFDGHDAPVTVKLRRIAPTAKWTPNLDRWHSFLWTVKIALALAFLLCSGCATIVSGTKQTVRVESHPPGARVVSTTGDEGVTPCKLVVSRRSPEITFTKEGYSTETVTPTSRFGANKWYWCNFVFGGLIGMIVDIADGAAWSLKDDTVTATLMERGTEAAAWAPPPEPARAPTIAQPNVTSDAFDRIGR